MKLLIRPMINHDYRHDVALGLLNNFHFYCRLGYNYFDVIKDLA